MDKKEFIKAAKKKGIPNFLYNIDGKGRDDERFCLVADNGKMECILRRTRLQNNEFVF